MPIPIPILSNKSLWKSARSQEETDAVRVQNDVGQLDVSIIFVRDWESSKEN
jgi:hypothetical protein